MLQIKMNGQPYDFPTLASELTLKQFFAIRNAKSLIEEVCAITGMDKQTVANFKSPKDIANVTVLMNQLGADLKKGFNNKTLPKNVDMAGKKISVPKKPRLEPVGAFMAVHDIIAEEVNRCQKDGVEMDFTHRIPEILANYFYVPYTGDLYSDEKVESDDYMEAIMSIKLVDAVPIGNFFFRKFPNL